MKGIATPPNLSKLDAIVMSSDVTTKGLVVGQEEAKEAGRKGATTRTQRRDSIREQAKALREKLSGPREAYGPHRKITQEEVDLIVDLRVHGMAIADVATILHRSANSISKIAGDRSELIKHKKRILQQKILKNYKITKDYVL